MNTPLDYNTLTNPQRRAITAYYARKFGGTQTAPTVVNGHVLIALCNSGWLETDSRGGLVISTAGIEAVRVHKLAKKADSGYRAKLETVQRQARIAKERLKAS